MSARTVVGSGVELEEGGPTAEPVTTTHRLTYSNRLRVFIGPDDSVINFLRPLRRLDGFDSYSVNLTRLPHPMPASEITATLSAAPGRNSVECIGSADMLAIELRTDDGMPHRYLLGLPGERIGYPGVDVPNGPELLRVYPDEIFAAEHAAEVFATYFHTGDIPAGFQLREVLD
ncbi:hypothetical protein ACIHDR_42275 [Nocardia sp. NPDC052278]|uniref:hypothetical protein n=1 Tax=unclassified Nocardia TaxID=2637762 RepID=UPI00367A4784